MVEGSRMLVTGASSGLGEEMAYKYARIGASVLLQHAGNYGYSES